MNETEQFYSVTGDAIVDGPYARPRNYGENTIDERMAEDGVYRLFVDTPPTPGFGWTLNRGEMQIEGIRVVRHDTYVQIPPDELRLLHLDSIESQVPDAPVKEVIRDPEIQNDISRYSAAATAKAEELQATADEELVEFDPTLTVNPGESEAFSRFSLNIVELKPWAGNVDAIYGLRATLAIAAGDTRTGDTARLQEFTPRTGESGAVQSFTQDPDDPLLWIYEQADGWKWEQATSAASGQLLWDGGSVPVSPLLTCFGTYDRKSVVVGSSAPGSKGRSITEMRQAIEKRLNP